MCPNEFPSIIKGLSRGRRVHRGHRDMPPACPPVVTEAPLSPWRALRRGEDPPPPPASGRGAALHPHFISEARRFAGSLGAWGGRGGPRTGRWLQSHRDGDVHREPGRRRSAGPSGVGRTRTPVWSRTDPQGFQRTTGKFVKSAFPERSGRGGFRSSSRPRRLRSPRHLNP